MYGIKYMYKKILTLVFLLTIILLSACDISMNSIDNFVHPTGSVLISLEEDNFRIITPEGFSLDVDYYKKSGIDPNGASITPIAFTGTALAINNIIIENWLTTHEGKQ